MVDVVFGVTLCVIAAGWNRDPKIICKCQGAVMPLDNVLDTIICMKVVALLVLLPVTVIPEIFLVLIPERVGFLWFTMDEN